MHLDTRLLIGPICCVLAAALAPACSGDDTGSSPTNTDTQTGGGGQGGTGAGGTGAGGTGAGGTGAGGTGAGGSGGQTGSLPPTAANCDPPSGASGGLALTEVVSGLQSSVLVTSPWGDGERLFIVEQRGVVQLWRNNSLSVFLDIDAKVQSGGERGLLGLAFHPDYQQNGRFFVHYSDLSGDTVVEEYQRSNGDPDVADPDPVGPVLFALNQPYGNHNGGSIEFSPVDGMLYIGLGDGGSGGDPDGNGQNIDTLLATLLRIDVSQNPYTIPDGNLVGGQPEIYDWGLRNPWRFSFDVCTGDRYIGDVGQYEWEEIDVAAADDANLNWGWNTTEGNHCFSPQNGCDMTGLTMPATEYDHGAGCSVTGGYVYRGSNIPWLRGAYLYGDYCTGVIWMLRWSDGQVTDEAEVMQSGLSISSFGQDDAGEVYVVAHGGTVYRLDPQ